MRKVLNAAVCLAALSAPARAQQSDPERIYKAAGALAAKPRATIAYAPIAAAGR